ncbi:hypothetical protein SAMN05518800_0492 [Variovorax sp. YR752]|uniref:hypothetical protein n=1 Tax=Variovorax sp. YR752 TaxID=1884383 RepID=UPI000BCF4667|nr:hypothetical protein [Variovorax sp. YR752]SOD22501.1 hypothetical protein SAMN05518800_0492 [Variovorax sp. YR752]
MSWWIDDTKAARGPRFRQPTVFLVCLVASVGLHAFFLGARSASPHAEGKNVVRMRVNTHPLLIPAGATTLATSSDAQQEAVAVDAVASAPESSTSVSVLEDARTPLTSQPVKISSPVEIRAAVPNSFEEYIPRAHLTVAPVATRPVILESPPGETANVRHLGVLLLYIDETGKVQDAIAQEPLLPEAYERAARAAFMAAQFSPGEFAGRAVKSSLRVEVVFESTAPAAR